MEDFKPVATSDKWNYEWSLVSSLKLSVLRVEHVQLLMSDF